MQNYVGEYGTLDEKLKFVHLPLCVAELLRFKILKNALETSGLSYTNKVTKPI